tara:strand:- start:1768 stop:4218 length:2451 start_codon:yes stop_codon:yes gene_type:complete
MVNFLWGNSNQSFPASVGRIKSEMIDFIQDKNRDFIPNYNNSLETAKENNSNPDDIKKEFKSIYEDILKESLLDYIKNHDEGKRAIDNFTTFKVNKEKKTNEANKEFLNEESLTLDSLFDVKVMSKLRGQGAIGVKKDTKIENFDWKSLLDGAYTKEDYTDEMTVDFVFREALPTDMDKYDPSERKYSYGKDQIMFRLPATDNVLIESKEEHINKTTLQQPDFYARKSKLTPPSIRFTMNIDLPSSVISELEAPPELEIQEVEPILNKNNKETGRYKRTGSPERINTPEFNALRIGKEHQRTQGMIENRVFRIDDKLFQIVMGSVSGAGKTVRVPESVIKTIEDNMVTQIKQIEKNALSNYLSDPMNVYSYVGVANFKTDSMFFNSLTRKTEKFYDPKTSPKDKYESMEVVMYDEKTKEAKTKSLTVKQAQALESEAWENKETKEKISNAGYNFLSEEEKSNYRPTYYIIEFETGEQLNPLREKETTFKKIVGYRLKDAPEKAYALIPKKSGYAKLKDRTLGEGYDDGASAAPPDSQARRSRPNVKDNRLPAEIHGKERMDRLKGRLVASSGKGQLTTKEGIAKKLKNDTDFKEKFKTVDNYIKVNDLVPALSFYAQQYKLHYDEGKFVSKTALNKYKTTKTKEKDETGKMQTYEEENPYLLVNVKKLKEYRELYEPVYEEETIDDKRKRYNQKSSRRAKKSSKSEMQQFMDAPTIEGKQEAVDYKITSPDRFGVERLRSMSVVTDPEGLDKGPLVFYENVEKAFSPVTILIDILIKHLGQFKLTPYRRRKNEEMISVLEDLKENLLTLKQKLGVQ